MIPQGDSLRKLANRRISAFWPPNSAEHGDCDVVLCFRNRFDAEQFVRALMDNADGAVLHSTRQVRSLR